jgi:phenylalanyl-tRNA synthetase beta chain
MKLSYNWLKQLANFKESPEKLAELLTMHVANVEKVEKLGPNLNKVIVAEIVDLKPHPNADKLRVVIVKTNYPSTQVPKYLTIVCGASNIKVGQKVPLALPGAKLPNGLEIQTAVIRGVKSEGMLCAEDELGIGPDHTGIYILPPESKIGESINKVLGLDDTILEIENKSITHRPDLFSHIGFAREIATIFGKKFKIQNSKFKIHQQKSTNLNIKVKDFKLCPRYMAVVMDNVKIAPSPVWLQNRLRNLGIRPINNVVDITNYILVEIGQPLHAFDANKLVPTNYESKRITNKEVEIIIRRAEKGEKLLALDGKEYELNENDLVIANSKQPIALAGIMGGELFSINPDTKTIVIESANFDSVTIRRTSWRLGLRTESALRFEKGLPINFPEAGIYRAIELIQELAGGRVVSKIFDLISKETIEKLKQSVKIIFDPEKVQKFIGLKIPSQQMIKILTNLGCQVKKKGKKYLVIPPIYRPDLVLFEDLIEEIVRIYGTDKIISQPIVGKFEPVEYESEFILERELKNILVGCGFDEVYNYSFEPRIDADPASRGLYESALLQRGQRESALIEVANPLNPEQKYLRHSLIPGLIKNAEKNRNYFDEFKIFEIGKVFAEKEKKKVAGLIYRKDPQIYFLAKGVVELILEKLGIENEKVNFIIKTEDNMAVFELDFEDLLPFLKNVKQYKFISPYPPVKRDLAFLVDKKISWQEIFSVVKNIDPLVKEIDLFDVFEDKKFGEKRNLAFHIIYQSDERTLKAEDIEKIQQKIIQTLKEKFGAELRNF